LVSAEADKLAAEISTAPKLMAREIKSRMDVSFEGGSPSLVIKGADGKPDPKLKIEDVKKDLLANADLKPILIGNKASGAAGPKQTLPVPGATGTSQQSNTEAKANVMELSGPDFLAHVEAKRAAKGQSSGPAAQ
jgi:hypothetical protein